MSRDYQPKKNNPYYLPTPLYRQMLWMVRDYDRMAEEYHNAIWDSPEPPDGQPRGARLGNPTEREAIRRTALRERIDAIEQSLAIVPEEYRKAIWENIQHHRKYPNHFSKNTYSKWRSRFIHNVAKKMRLI